MENGTGCTIKGVMFDNAKELVTGRMKEYYEHKGIRINSSVPYSPLSNGIADSGATNGTRAMLHDSNLLGRRDDDLHVPAQEDAKEGVTPSERFSRMEPDVGIYVPA